MEIQFKKYTTNQKRLLVKKKLSYIEPLDQPGILYKAQIHGSAQRLLKIEKITKYVKFCKCCRLPTETTGAVIPFNFSDNKLDFGLGIFLYFYFMRFMIFVLAVTICMAAIPSMYLSTKLGAEITFYCKSHYNTTNSILPSIVTTSRLCLKYLTYLETSINLNKITQSDFISLMSCDSLKVYYALYKEQSTSVNIDDVVSDYSFLYFLAAVTLFITNILVILHARVLDEGENIQETTPSDFTVLIEDLEVWQTQDIKDVIKDIVDKTDIPDTKFEIYDIIPCLKIGELYTLARKNYQAKTMLYHMENLIVQKRYNENDKNKQDNLHYYVPKCCCRQKKIPKAFIENIIKETEEKSTELEKDIKENPNKYFGGGAYLIFNTIEQKDNFYKYFPTTFWTKIYYKLKTFFILVLCKKCNKYTDKEKRALHMKSNIILQHATEAAEIVWENLGYTRWKRFLFSVLANLITIVLMGISLGIVFGINRFQFYSATKGYTEIQAIQYIVSAIMSLFIVVSNVVIRMVVIFIARIEKKQTLTEFHIAISYKIMFYYFINTGIIPLISNYSYDNWGNNEILLSNIFFIFLTNCIMPPFLFYFSPNYMINLCKRYKAKKILKNVNVEDSPYTQRELNFMFENTPMHLGYKYAFITNNVLLALFYCPIFPLGCILCLIGIVLTYFLEICYTSQYKRPEMYNSKLCKFYVTNFKFALFIFGLGNYIFLSETLLSIEWPLINVILFAIIAILPINSIKLNLIGISEGETNSTSYEDNYLQFSIDYEKQNPMTKKEGMIKYFKKASEASVIKKRQVVQCMKKLLNENAMEQYLKTSQNIDNLLASIEMKNRLEKISKTSKRKNVKDSTLITNSSEVIPLKSVPTHYHENNKAITNMMMFLDGNNKDDNNPWSLDLLYNDDKVQDKNKVSQKKHKRNNKGVNNVIHEEDNEMDMCGNTSDFSEKIGEKKALIVNDSNNNFEISFPSHAVSSQLLNSKTKEQHQSFNNKETPMQSNKETPSNDHVKNTEENSKKYHS